MKCFLSVHRWVPLLILLALLLAACDGLGSGDEREPIRPLAVGNYWAYTLDYFVFPTDTFRVEITRAVELPHEGRRVQTFAEQFFNVDGTLRVGWEKLLFNRAEGLYQQGGLAEADTFLTRTLAYKYPAKVGETWPFVRYGYDRFTQKFVITDTLTMTLVATDEEIETPAGTFTCYVYNYSFLPADDVATPWDVYDYFAPGVGNVAQIIRNQPRYDSEGNIVQEAYLYDYRVQ